MLIEKAANMLEVNEDLLKEFKVDDTFNNNTITGVLCRQSGQLYGTMVLFEVNDEKVVPQIIYGTPKIKYPFNSEGKFNWPPIEHIIGYEKMDGTNILKYLYRSPHKDFITFKTRLSPVLSDDNPYNTFYSLWKEILQENKWVMDVIEENPAYNLSFELYGSRNNILIEYDIPLAARLLFGINVNDGCIIPPLGLHLIDIKTKIPIAYYVDCDKNITDGYNYLRTTFLETNTINNRLVTEGAVWYVCSGSKWVMYKLKPEDIEKIHWAASGVIPKHSLRTTAFNLFESGEPTIDNFIALLKEEYPPKLIHDSMPRIKRVYKEVARKVEIKNKINEVWFLAQKKGLDVTRDKVATLRFISKYFNKKEMKVVGSTILKQAGLLGEKE